MEKEKIESLRAKGLGMHEAKVALEKTGGNVEAALIYYITRSQACCRYKIVNGEKVQWTDEDYIREALNEISTEQRLQ